MALRVVASFRDAHSAHIARAKLEAAGIPAFVTDEHLVGVQWFYSDAIGGVKIQVPEAYVDQARELVTADLSGDLRRVRGPRRARRFERCESCEGELLPSAPSAREIRAGERRLVVWSTRQSCRDCGRTH